MRWKFIWTILRINWSWCSPRSRVGRRKRPSWKDSWRHRKRSFKWSKTIRIMWYLTSRGNCKIRQNNWKSKWRKGIQWSFNSAKSLKIWGKCLEYSNRRLRVISVTRMSKTRLTPRNRLNGSVAQRTDRSMPRRYSTQLHLNNKMKPTIKINPIAIRPFWTKISMHRRCSNPN